MAAVMPAPAASRLLLSGNEAVARAVWEAGVKVAAAYPGTPSTEMLEVISTYPDLYAEWSVNEKVSLEVAIGAAYAGSRAFCCMKHVGMNVASDALMTLTLTGVIGGLVIAIADDVGLSFIAERTGLALLGALRPCAGARAGRFAGGLCDDAGGLRVVGAISGAGHPAHDDADQSRQVAGPGRRAGGTSGRWLQEGAGALRHGAGQCRQAYSADVQARHRIAGAGRNFGAELHRAGG